jgi:DNA-binding transcriptional MocR family regulator
MPARREQIREILRQRVISGLHLGILSPGERLPSARDTARELGADYRVVVAALRALERDGLVEVRPRVGTDPRFADKLRLLFGDEPGAANLHPVILGRDPLEQIPDDAPLLLSPAARARLAGHPVLARVLPPRGYSQETSRQLLTFIVERNVDALLAEPMGDRGPGNGGGSGSFR